MDAFAFDKVVAVLTSGVCNPARYTNLCLAREAGYESGRWCREFCDEEHTTEVIIDRAIFSIPKGSTFADSSVHVRIELNYVVEPRKARMAELCEPGVNTPAATDWWFDGKRAGPEDCSVVEFDFAETTDDADIEIWRPHLEPVKRLMPQATQAVEALSRDHAGAVATHGRTVGIRARRGQNVEEEIAAHFHRRKLETCEVLTKNLEEALVQGYSVEPAERVLAGVVARNVARVLCTAAMPPLPPVKDNPHVERRRRKK